MEPTLISHVHAITLDQESNWVKMTDLMGREYLFDPKAALELAIWVAEQYDTVTRAQAKLELARRMEEAAVYKPLLDTITPEEQPSEHINPLSRPPSGKRRKTSRTSKDHTT